MNSKSIRPSYGTLPLTPEITRGVQLEWAAVESPVQPGRFRDFPFVDLGPDRPAPRPAPDQKRPLAA